MIVGRNYVYIFCTKTGTMTIRTVLKEQFGGSAVGRLRQVRPEDWDKFVFSTCRNPYERFVSWWYKLIIQNKHDRYGHKRQLDQMKLTHKKPDGFIKAIHRSRKEDYSYHHVDKLNPGVRWVHMENLEEEFNALPFVKKYVELPRINSHPHRPHWRELITPWSVEFINENYAEDFRIGGYEMLTVEGGEIK
jgi:hypothetical protein